MKYYSDYQERITEDMLALTRNLREQTETANKIIKRDTEVIFIERIFDSYRSVYFSS